MGVPKPTPRHFHALSQPFGAPVADCIRGYKHLAEKFDPRRYPPEWQPWLLDYQHMIDEAMSLVWDTAAEWGEEVAA
jgi:hypothetical protein